MMQPNLWSSRGGLRVSARTAAALCLAAGGLAGCGVLSSSAPSAKVGDCVDIASLEGEEVTDIATLDCAQEHDGQVIHVFEMPDGDYPTDEEWSAAIEQECIEGFEEFVGTAYGESELTARDLSPTEESWESGDRQVLCVAFTEDGPVTESFEGAEI